MRETDPNVHSDYKPFLFLVIITDDKTKVDTYYIVNDILMLLNLTQRGEKKNEENGICCNTCDVVIVGVRMWVKGSDKYA